MEKVALVTGCGSGFGLLIAKTLADAGHTVVATMREPRSKNAEAARALQAWAQEHDRRIHVVELDVTSTDSVEAAVEQALHLEGRIDVAVNNAGVATMGYGEAFTAEQVRRLFEVNVIGPHRVIRAVAPHMRRQRTGLLVLISSEAAAFPAPFHGAYPASKAAAEGIAEGYRHELAPFGIDSVIVQPGGFPTSLTNNAMRPDDAGRLEEYGPLAGFPERFFAASVQALSGPGAPDPQAVADAVHALVDTAPGQRPLRTVVDRMGFTAVTEGIEAINTTTEEIRARVLSAMGLGEAIRLVPGEW